MIELLKHRFLENMVRHPNLDWAVVEQFLRNNPKAIQTLRLMEEKLADPEFIGDTVKLLRPGISYDPYQAWELVKASLLEIIR